MGDGDERMRGEIEAGDEWVKSNKASKCRDAGRDEKRAQVRKAKWMRKEERKGEEQRVQ